ncbi:gamma-glutamyltransferase [Novacetimonas pomaceti]|uniref:gamma-glutamyltransferase n=1 Tax=Novacetimonas pomaceti TaxID=2021998 RepID=UPI0038CF5733
MLLSDGKMKTDARRHLRWSRRTGGLLLAAVLLLSDGVACAAPAGGTVQDDPLAFGGGSAPVASMPPVGGRDGMVVSAQTLASQVGARILRQGGNAVDAAVAVGYALAVVYPAAGNIGGGGFMTLRTPDGHAIFLDFREHAPAAATATMFQDASGNVIAGLSTKGWKAVGIPGTVAGLELARQRWGHLSRRQVMAPAIALARDGFVLTDGDVELISHGNDDFRRDSVARRFFLRPDGSALQAGDRLVQRELAQVLERISRQGTRGFYEGRTAAEIVEASRRGGGILTRADLSGYRPRVLPTLTCDYRGYHIDTAPPPSGGGVALCEMLNILSGYDMHRLGLYTAPAVTREVEAMRHAYADRQDLGDPAFVANPVAHLLDVEYARQIRAAIPTGHAVPSASIRPGLPTPEGQETTHYSVIDRDGMAVAVTYTLNGWFGAGMVAGRTGVFMNDEMDDFSTRPGTPNMFGIVGSKANEIAPGKTPLSSMTPTVISRDGRPVMVIGSPGGSRIPTIVLSVVLGVIDYGLDIQHAVDLPRIHEQWQPEAVQVEQGALTPGVIDTLRREGYSFQSYPHWGVAEGILVGGPRLNAPAGDARYYGGADRRHSTSAAVGE